MSYLNVGDLVRHRHGTMHGTGIILDLMAMVRLGLPTQAKILWTNPHGQTVIQETVATRYLEVIK